jgi:L-Ala-D/L-Glu epimerase
MKVELERRSYTFAEPIEAAYGALRERDLLVLTIVGPDGLAGRGEAAPLEPYDGVSLERAATALERYAAVLERVEDGPPGAALDACRAADDLPQALAAVDMALWDLAGKRAGRPVAELLAERPARRVSLCASIAACDRAGTAAEAARLASAGFACVKVKVGIGDDAGRVVAARAALGPHVALRLDANGAWNVDEAVRAIEALAPAGLELIEEPVHGVAAVQAVRERVATRVAIDETAAEAGALTGRVADAVCLKISRCGGISGLLAAAALVRATGSDVYVGSTYDGPLGIAAALHAAAAWAGSAQLLPCGLATLSLFAEDDGRFAPLDGSIDVPDEPGLGLG